MKRVLITGGNGFVAHHWIEHMLKNTDWNIVTLDRLSNPNIHGYDKLRDIKAYDNNRVQHFQHDLNMEIGEGLASELGKFDYILHVAAGSHVDNSITDPVPFVKNNVNSTLTMLEYARKHPVERFLYLSTDEVYGTAPEGVDYKEGDRYNPGNPYSASKAAAECLCYAYSNTYKVPIVITNSMNILGERQDPEKFFPKVINYVLDGKVLPIHSNKEKTEAGKRHYIHARNIASAMMFILQNTTETLNCTDSSLGKFHIVGEEEVDNLGFAKRIAKAVSKATGKDLELKYEMVDFHSSRPGHDLRYALSGEKLAKLGWEPPRKLDESIQAIVNWSLKEENLRWLGR
jgi:dTDP-glucose 4,6-dehydratase